MPKITSLHVSLPEDLKEFVRQEVAEGGYSTPSDFVRSLLRQKRSEKLRSHIDQTLLASLETPADEVTAQYLATLREEAQELAQRKRTEKKARSSP